jgi:hypothetical protein
MTAELERSLTQSDIRDLVAIAVSRAARTCA